MGLFDSLTKAVSGILGQAASEALPGLIQNALNSEQIGGLSGVLEKLQQAGLGEQVNSWLGNGENLPISAEQLKSVLSEEHVRQISEMIGISPDTALEQLAQYLPGVVDRLSPTGKLEA